MKTQRQKPTDQQDSTKTPAEPVVVFNRYEDRSCLTCAHRAEPFADWCRGCRGPDDNGPYRRYKREKRA